MSIKNYTRRKFIACGEGGAVVGDDEALMDKVYTVMNHGTSRKGRHELIGPKYRMNEFEAALLLAQLEGVHERHYRRNENCWYMRRRLRDFPGVLPQKLYSAERLKKYRDELPLPNCDRACNEEVLTLGSVPNTSMENLDKIYNAIIKVYENRDKLNSL